MTTWHATSTCSCDWELMVRTSHPLIEECCVKVRMDDSHPCGMSSCWNTRAPCNVHRQGIIIITSCSSNAFIIRHQTPLTSTARILFCSSDLWVSVHENLSGESKEESVAFPLQSQPHRVTAYLLLRFRSLYLRVASGVYPIGSVVRHRGQCLYF